jgi:hypothetical protein
MVMDIGSLSVGFIRLPISADSAAVPVSLFGESCYTVCAIAGVECSQVHAWTILENPTMANNNQRDDSGSGEQ